VNMLKDGFQVGFRHQVKRFRYGAAFPLVVHQQAQGAHADLLLRLFARDIQHRATAFRHFHCHLQHQGRFADSRVAADQDDGTGHHAAAQHPGKFANRQGQAFLRVAGDFREFLGVRFAAEPARGGRGGRVENLFHHCPVTAAGWAASHGCGSGSPAFLTYVLSLCLRHRRIIAQTGLLLLSSRENPLGNI